MLWVKISHHAIDQEKHLYVFFIYAARESSYIITPLLNTICKLSLQFPSSIHKCWIDFNSCSQSSR